MLPGRCIRDRAEEGREKSQGDENHADGEPQDKQVGGLRVSGLLWGLRRGLFSGSPVLRW